MRQVVDAGEPDRRSMRVGAGQRDEIDIVDRVLAIAIDEVDQAAADPLDGRDVEFHRAELAVHRPGAELDGALIGGGRILDAKGDDAHRRAVQPARKPAQSSPARR